MKSKMMKTKKVTKMRRANMTRVEVQEELLKKLKKKKEYIKTVKEERDKEELLKKKKKEREKWVLTFPVAILEDERLSPTDRLILAFIIALDNEKGCYSTNKKLAKLVGCSSSAISKSVSKMFSKDYKYIVANDENKNGRGGYTRRVALPLKAHKYDYGLSEFS